MLLLITYNYIWLTYLQKKAFRKDYSEVCI
jgi:hypothetical protein